MKFVKSFLLIILLISLNSYIFSENSVDEQVVLPEKPIVVVIPSFNNKIWLERNLGSLFSQNYTNCKFIYIDDCSTDETPDFVEDFVKKNNQQHRFTLIRNKYRKGALENLWIGIHMAKDDDIVVTWDGDDWAPDKEIFNELNKVYEDKNVWLTYGQFKLHPSGAVGWCCKYPEDIIKNHAYRKFDNIPSHLRTFRAGLFKGIQMKDLVNYDGFYPMAWDIAMMIPMVERAAERHKFISRIMYIYNDETPLNDHKINKQLQNYLANVLRAKKPYERLEKTYIDEKNTSKADVLIFSQESPAQLMASIESINYYATGINKIRVIYRAKDEQSRAAYQKVKEIYPDVSYYNVNTKIPYYLKYIAGKVSKEISTDYVLLVSDNVLLVDYVNLEDCMRAMKKTWALGFYLRLGKNITDCYPYKFGQKIPRNYEVASGVSGWVYQYGQGDWAYPINFEMTLFNSEKVKEILQTGHFQDISGLELIWGVNTDLDNVGLCFEKSKSVKVILNISEQELIYKFKDGYKLDFSELKNIQNVTARIEWDPKFVKFH